MGWPSPNIYAACAKLCMKCGVFFIIARVKALLTGTRDLFLIVGLGLNQTIDHRHVFEGGSVA
jgi:hypothetical protein